MRRVMIIGSGGSGKSVLARALGRRTGLPVYHLDRLFWQPGWQPLDADAWQSLQIGLCARPAWILDGTYTSSIDLRIAAADTVVFLDLPTRACLLGVLIRFLRYRNRTRPDLPAGCRERLAPGFLRRIYRFRRERRPGILRRLDDLRPDQTAVILRSRREARAWVSSLPAQEKP